MAKEHLKDIKFISNMIISVFNAVIRMCLVEIPQAVHKILDLPVTTDLQKPVLPSSKNLKWKKVRLDMKSYLADVLQVSQMYDAKTKALEYAEEGKNSP